MKLVTFLPPDGNPRAGVVVGEAVIDLATAAPLVLEEPEQLSWGMLDLLCGQQPEVSLATAAEIVAVVLEAVGSDADPAPMLGNGSYDHGMAGTLAIGGAEMLLPLSQVTLCAPLPQPASLRLFDTVHGYWQPVFQFGNHHAILAPDVPLPAPDSGSLAVLPALTCVIGQRGKNIHTDDALEHVAALGMALQWYNPLIVEEARSLGISLAKAYDFATSCGAYLFTPDELEIYTDSNGYVAMDVSIRINAVERWHGNLMRQRYPLPMMIAHASRGVMLHAGDMLLTYEIKPPAPIMLHAGDHVELEITGMGTLTSTVATAA